MAIEFSEVVWFVSNPEESADLYKRTLGWKEIERFQDSWILLATPGDGKIGFMRHNRQADEKWPSPMVAFKSSSIKEDIAAVKANGLDISDVIEGTNMWHATYSDESGNKILIWQELQ